MGYTHYWKRKKEIEPIKFEVIRRDFARLMDLFDDRGIRLAGPDGSGQPEGSKVGIFFNGVHDCGHGREGPCGGHCSHESFWFPRVSAGDRLSFCKTAAKPYDLAVQCCLIIASHILRGDITITSDGSSGDWLGAVAICQEFLGYGQNFKLDG